MFTALETMIGEFGQTLRGLARERGFATAFVLTLALGIGANGAIFSALNAYLVRPLPYPQAGQLANVYINSHVLPHGIGITSAYAAEMIGSSSPGIASWGLYQGGTEGRTATIISNGEPKSVGAVSVTASLFKTLGVAPLLGRWIDPASNRPGGAREVVVSHRFWQSALGGKPNVIGQTLEIDGEQYTLVGVMPKGFMFPNRSVQLWRSLVLTPMELGPARLTQFNWNMIVRRAPGVSQAAFQTMLAVLNERFVARFPEQKAFKPYIGAISLRQWFGGATGGELLLMQLGAVLLLIVAAANLGNLALVRVLRRRHEFDMRIMLGASRWSLHRLSLFETIPLGIAAAVLGWFLSRVGAQALVYFGIASGGTAFAVGTGGSMAFLGVVLSLIVAFIALSAPLLVFRPRHLAALLQTGGRGAASSTGSRCARKGLSVVQIALAVMLLSASALVGFSLQRILAEDLGFNSNNLTVATVKLAGPGYTSYGQVASAWRATQSAVAALPGVRSVGLGYGMPFTGTASGSAFRIAQNGPPVSNPGITAPILVANPELLKTLDVRLLHGRLLGAADSLENAAVEVVDARFAERLFGTTDVVGREVQGGDGITRRIVGVIGTIKASLTRDSANVRGRVIVPEEESCIWTGPSVQIVMRSPLPTRTVMRDLKSALAQALPGQAITHVASMHELIGESVRGTSALVTLLTAFGLLALALASVGTYGVVAYLTRMRRHEFAIRIALGARSWQIEWLVLAQGLTLWVVGTVIGIGCAVVFGHLLRDELNGVSLLSPAAYIIPAIVLGAVAVFASWLPARRVRRTALTETLNAQ